MALADVFKNLSKKTKIITVSGALAVIAAAVLCVVFARSGYMATTMRLLRVEGAVNIEDANGTTKPIQENVRFKSGDALNTGTDGLASVGLDNTKVITLQNDSRAEFRKKRKQLELKLTKGAVFFNVTEKLKADEKFEIKTSTMTAGIRGTSGMVYYDAADGGREALLITDGSVEVSATNPETGETKSTLVEAGQTVKVYLFFDRAKDSVAFELSNVTEATLPKFAAARITENDALAKRVCDANNWQKDDVRKKAAAPESTTTAAPTTEATTTAEETTITTTSQTSETTESTTEETTAKPTATPTAKPKATSTPKPTPTKKPTPKATETSAETATQTTSSEPAIPSGYKKWAFGWGNTYNGSKVYVCQKIVGEGETTDFKGYENGKWIELTYKPSITIGKTVYTLTRQDGSTYYVYNLNEPAPTTTGITPPSGYSKWIHGWNETFKGTTVYVCKKMSTADPDDPEYMGYENGRWIELQYRTKSGGYVYAFYSSSGSLYYGYGSNQTQPTSTLQVVTDPKLPDGYTKDSSHWGISYLGKDIFICYRKDSDGSIDYKGFDKTWFTLTLRTSSTSGKTTYTYETSGGDVYYTYSKTNPTTTTTTTTTQNTVPTPPDGYSKLSDGWGKSYGGHNVYICNKSDKYLGYVSGQWVTLKRENHGGGWYDNIVFYTPDGDEYFKYDAPLLGG